MSLFTDYLASLSSSSSSSSVDPAEAAENAAKAKAEQEALDALEVLQQKAESDAKALENAGLLTDYQELVEVENAIKLDAEAAESQVAIYAAMKDEADVAAALIEEKAKAIESLVSKMEAEGLLAGQIEATKQGYLDNALSAHNAAKASKERIAKLLANKKIK